MAPGGGGQPTWDDQRYGSLLLGGFCCDGGVNATVQSMVDSTQTVSMCIWPRLPLDLAISCECDLLGYWEEQWLKDCVSRYDALIDSLEKLHVVRTWMNWEGPRWWREPGNGDIVWMPSKQRLCTFIFPYCATKHIDKLTCNLHLEYCATN